MQRARSVGWVSASPFQRSELGPICSQSAPRDTVLRPRSVNAHRVARGPCSETLTAQWFSGSPPPPAPGPVVIRREDASEKRDDGDAVLAIVAQRVDIPPRIATRRDGPAEVRSATSADAASRPDSAAIGTPAPGCTLPPRQIEVGYLAARSRTPERGHRTVASPGRTARPRSRGTCGGNPRASSAPSCPAVAGCAARTAPGFGKSVPRMGQSPKHRMGAARRQRVR